MTCWPPCGAWCDCVDDQCQPSAPKPNALRIRTSDNRYLRAINGPTVTYGYLGPTGNAPGPWDTFMIDQPGNWPILSGDQFVLHAVDDSWTPLPAPSLIRVDHTVRVIPSKSKKDPPIVTYQFGGPDVSVLVSPPLPPGYPGYGGVDPGEWSFTITKMLPSGPASVGAQIDSGDPVTFSFASNNPDQPVRSWRLRDDLSPSHVDGDAAPEGPAATVFIVEFNEVRPGLGWRPPEATLCRQCAQVTAVVSSRASGDAVGGATVTGTLIGADMSVTPPRDVTFSGTTPPAPSNGRADLTAFVDGAVRDCMPAGPIVLTANANRYQTATVTAAIPSQGPFNVSIPMDCTMLTGRVTDSAGSAVPGETVFLTDPQGNPLFDLQDPPQAYETNTDLDGRFSFACVPHGKVKVSNDTDENADREVTLGPASMNVDLILQRIAATVVVIVVDGDDNDRPITGANVRITTSNAAVRTATTSGTPPQATFATVAPSGTASVRATMTGYSSNTVPATIPPAGTLTVTIRLRRNVAIQRPTAIVMQLDWGALPRDLDLHCSGPDGTGGRFHCLFSNMQPVGFVRLDTDDRDATGPERIAVTQVAGAFVPGDYHCWIDRFSPSPGFDVSGASLTLLSLDANSLPTQRGRFLAADVPGALDRLWFVMRFTLDAQGQMTVTPVMTFQAGTFATVL